MKGIYIDESGNHGFDFSKQGNTKYFILTAIVINIEDKECIENDLDLLSKRLNHGAEFKSKKIKNHKVYTEIYKTMEKYEYKIFSYIVDKRSIWTDSALYQHKKSFFKYISSSFYSILNIHFPNIFINYDMIGRTDFQQSFTDYIDNKFGKQNKLFHMEGEKAFKFIFKDSKESRLIQLADLVCGRLKQKLEKDSVKDLFVEKLYPYVFPAIDTNIEFKSKIDKEVDKSVFEASMRGINEFMEKNKKNDTYIKHIKVIKYLCSELHLGNNKYISKKRIISITGIKDNELTNVIADLRDFPLLISSCRNGGHKIATSISEIETFIDTFHSTTKPMLVRMNKISRIIETNTGIDLLDKEKYKYIKSINFKY